MIFSKSHQKFRHSSVEAPNIPHLTSTQAHVHVQVHNRKYTLAPVSASKTKIPGFIWLRPSINFLVELLLHHKSVPSFTQRNIGDLARKLIEAVRYQHSPAALDSAQRQHSHRLSLTKKAEWPYYWNGVSVLIAFFSFLFFFIILLYFHPYYLFVVLIDRVKLFSTQYILIN